MLSALLSFFPGMSPISQFFILKGLVRIFIIAPLLALVLLCADRVKNARRRQR